MSKALTEYERHRIHCHPKDISSKDIFGNESSTASGLPGYSVGGLPLFVGLKKTTQKRTISHAEEDPIEEETAALAEDMTINEEGKDEQDEGGKQPRIETGARTMTGQH